MARISKVEKERRQQQAVRVDKARASILEQFSRMLTRHLPALIKPGTTSTAQLSIGIAEGDARIQFTYQTTVVDAAAFELDDGQEDLPMSGGNHAAEREAAQAEPEWGR